MSDSGTRILRVSTELLRQALKLPDDVEIIGTNTDLRLGAIDLAIRSGQFAPVPRGEVIPDVSAIYRSVRLDCGCDRAEFVEFK